MIQTATQERANKGRAYMEVSHTVAPEGVRVPRVGEAISNWWVRTEEELLKVWQDRFLLPENYTVIGAYFRVLYQQWAIIVESEAIPEPADGLMIPRLDATYQRTEDGKVSLIDLKVIQGGAA